MTGISSGAGADDAASAIEQVLAGSLQDKRGIMVYVNGQAIGGAMTRLEKGQWVELRNREYGKIIVRIERIDAVAQP